MLENGGQNHINNAVQSVEHWPMQMELLVVWETNIESYITIVVEIVVTSGSIKRNLLHYGERQKPTYPIVDKLAYFHDNTIGCCGFQTFEFYVFGEL